MAEWEPSVGMVCRSWQVDGDELLGLRGGLEKYRSSGSTFGIPLLYPWANRLDRDVDSPLVRRDPNGLAIHGVLAASPNWQTLRHDAERVTARLDFGAHDDYLAVFPYPLTIEIDVAIEPRAQTIATRVTPTGDVAVPLAFGWHPYLRIPGVARQEWDLTLPLAERLVLDDRMLPTGDAEPVDYPDPLRLGDRTFDDGYAGVADGTTFAVAGGGRRVEVEFVRGYPYAQVFAPPGEEVVCFEPMAAPTNALESGQGLRSVEPGDSFEAVFMVRSIP
jgi:galactose mutarotase-like enzyme